MGKTFYFVYFHTKMRDNTKVWIFAFLLSLLLWSFLPKRVKRTSQPSSSRGPREENLVEVILNVQDKTTEPAQQDPEIIVQSQPQEPQPASSLPTPQQFKCRHRTSKYAQKAKEPMSSKLSRLLKRYNRLHDKHSNQLSPSVSIKVPLTSLNNTIRYTFVRHTCKDRSDDCLAKEAYTLISAFLFSLLTDRVLIVGNADLQQTLCEPFTKSSWFASDDLTLFFESNQSDLSLDKALLTRRPLRSLQISADADRKHLQCSGNLKDTFGHVQWIVFDDSTGPFTDTIMNNQAHDQHLLELFPDGSIVAPLYRHLFHPSNVIWQDLPDLMKAYTDSTIEKPVKAALIGDIDSGKDHLLQELNQTGDRMVALLINAKDEKQIDRASELFDPSKFLIAASSAHFTGDTVLAVYGRFHANIYLSRIANRFVFEDTLYGWLLHALRQETSVLYDQNYNRDIPPLDCPPSDTDVNCQDQ